MDGGGLFNIGDSLRAEIEITTPSNTVVELQSSNGGVEVYVLKKSGTVRTSIGYGAHFQRVRCALPTGTVRTSNGRIVLDKVAGDFNVATSNGRVSITEAGGSFDVETSNGGIEFDGELIKGSSNRMATSNGSIDIRFLGTTSVMLDASTSNGSIDTEYPILTSSPGDEHHLGGAIGAGEAELIIRTSNGSVAIR